MKDSTRAGSPRRVLLKMPYQSWGLSPRPRYRMKEKSRRAFTRQLLKARSQWKQQVRKGTDLRVAVEMEVGLGDALRFLRVT